MKELIFNCPPPHTTSLKFDAPNYVGWSVALAIRREAKEIVRSCDDCSEACPVKRIAISEVSPVTLFTIINREIPPNSLTVIGVDPLAVVMINGNI